MKLLNRIIYFALIVHVACIALLVQTSLALATPLDGAYASMSDPSATVSECPWIASAMAAENTESGFVKILAPARDGVLRSGAGNRLKFNVKLGPSGNHLHIYIDDQSPIIYRDVAHCPCSIELPSLAPGRHTIAVKEATASHVLTGTEDSVTFTVK